MRQREAKERNDRKKKQEREGCEQGTDREVMRGREQGNE